jgi:hypothetical protein
MQQLMHETLQREIEARFQSVSWRFHETRSTRWGIELRRSVDTEAGTVSKCRPKLCASRHSTPACTGTT